MKTIIYKLVHIGVDENLSAYESKRVLIFNYSNLFGFLASLVRIIYLSLLSPNHYTIFTLLINCLPLLLCVIMGVFIFRKKYKTATYQSFLFFPPVLLLMYLATLDNSVSFFIILYFVFPFFFLHKRRNIIIAFIIAAACFLLVDMANELSLLFYKKDFYLSDTPLAWIDSIFALVFLFSSLFSIKFIVWSYEKSINHKKKELTELNQFKDKIFSVISHDLRSPFAATSQLIDLIKTVPMEQEEFNSYLTELKIQVDNARGLMDNMLVWAKKQMDHQEVIATNTRISEIVDETILSLYKQANGKQIQLINEVDPALHALTDKDMMLVIMRNLLSNAIKFTNEGGYVKIRTSVNNHNQLVLEVEDNGVGIPEEKSALVLGNEYFTSYGTANEKGSGLGLRICREFVEKNNGNLSFKSTPGSGTTFFITLPLSVPGDSRMQVITVDALQQKSPGFYPGTSYSS